MNKNKFITATFVLAILFVNPSFIFSEEVSDDFEEDVIEVTATKIGEPVAEQRLVIDEKEIEKSHCENLCGILEQNGIQILSYGAYGLESKPSIRGFTDETVRVVIDGICVNNPQYGTFDFSSLPLNQIEKIEIIKGGFSEGVSDEGAVGGAVYITTKKSGTEKTFTSDTSLKTFFNSNFPLDTIREAISFSAGLWPRTSIFTSANFALAKNLYLFKNYKNQISQRENSSVWDFGSSIGATHEFLNGNILSVNESVYAGNKNCPGVENNKNIGLQKDYNNRLIFNFTIPDFNNIFCWENSLAYLANVRFYDDNVENSKHVVNTIKGASYLSFFGNDWFKENVGLTLDGTFLDSTDDGQHNQFAATLKSDSKIYLPMDWNITVPLAVKVQNQNFAFIPKIGANKKFSFGEFNLAFYRMIQFPNMDDLYWNGSGSKGNPNLKPEDGWGGELSFNSFVNFLPVSISFFTNYYENKIQWASANGIWQPENIASAFYAGVDFNFEKDFFDKILNIKFNCEYLFTSLLDKNNSLTYGKKIMWTPDFVASLIVTVNFCDWMIKLDASYTGTRYTSNLNVSCLNPYVLLNGYVSYSGLKFFSPYLKLDNILCQSYQSVDSYPMPLISMTLGFNIKLNF